MNARNARIAGRRARAWIPIGIITLLPLVACSPPGNDERIASVDPIEMKMSYLVGAAYFYRNDRGQFPPHTNEAFIKALYLFNRTWESGFEFLERRSTYFLVDTGGSGVSVWWDWDANPATAAPHETDFTGPPVVLAVKPGAGRPSQEFLLIWQKVPFPDDSRWVATTEQLVRRVRRDKTVEYIWPIRKVNAAEFERLLRLGWPQADERPEPDKQTEPDDQ